nr:MAG: ORF1 [TTV-like mini virus]
MPWRFYRRRRNYWRRRRWPYRRRARKAFRRRYWKHRWVRKKLPKIKLIQFQPPKINKCTIKGMLCLLQCSKYRYSHNWTMYENSYAPEHLPNGGGFSIMKLSLQNLFDLHTYARNYWSKSNVNLPVCRYTGCKIRFYQSTHLDYIVKYQNYFPMTSGPLTYPSTQPSIMLQTRGTIVIPSKNTEKRRKPYKTVFIKPPSQLTNKWYFQKELANIPLALIYTTATSLDNFYIPPTATSNTLTITTLNTKLITNRQWKTNPSNGWAAKSEGTISIYLYASREATENPTAGSMIPLARTTYYTAGKCFNDLHWQESKWTEWKQNTSNTQSTYWGNPFYADYLQDDDTYNLYQSQYGPLDFYKQFSKSTDNIAEKATKLHNGIILKTRYNINRDNGQDNRIYLKSNTKAETGWAPPTDPDLEITGLSLWLGLWGFVDYQKKLQKTIGIDTENMLVIQTTHTQPIITNIVPLDISFTSGHSPHEDEINPYDRDKWYPQIQYQEQSINDIVSAGPGCPKLDWQKSGEAHALYKFYFKFGGAPAPMSSISNPEHETTYPLPSNFNETSSLQNPGKAIETYLQGFDERRQMLTETATKRMQRDWETKDPFIQYAGLSMDPDNLQAYQTLQIQAPTEEESEENLLQQLLQQRQQQRLLKHRILQLMDKYQNLE